MKYVRVAVNDAPYLHLAAGKALAGPLIAQNMQLISILHCVPHMIAGEHASSDALSEPRGSQSGVFSGALGIRHDTGERPDALGWAPTGDAKCN